MSSTYFFREEFSNDELKKPINYRNVKLIKATRKDWDYILFLRNSNYEYFQLQGNLIDKKEHYKYMERKEIDPNFYHYLYDKKCYVRIDDKDIAVITDPKYQGMGLATNAIVEICKLHGTKFFASIQMDNISSFKAFYKAMNILSDHRKM